MQHNEDYVLKVLQDVGLVTRKQIDGARTRLNGASSVVDLWQRRAGFRFHQPNVGAIEVSIDIYVLTEIRAADDRTRLRFGLSDVGGIDRRVRGRVTDEHAHFRPNEGATAVSR